MYWRLTMIVSSWEVLDMKMTRLQADETQPLPTHAELVCYRGAESSQGKALPFFADRLGQTVWDSIALGRRDRYSTVTRQLSM